MTIVAKVLGLLGALVLAGWLYYLSAKVLLLLTYAEQLLGVAAQTFGTVPSKSAARTTAPDDAPAYVPYTGLRDRDDTDRWADDGGPEPAAEVDEPVVEPITEPIPVVQPQTEPTPRVDVVGGARVVERPVPHKRGRHAA